MSYFGILTCPNCGQKISFEPPAVIVEDGEYKYQCRRCKFTDLLPEDFTFKSPTGRDINVADALRSENRKQMFNWPSWLLKLFNKDI